MRRLIMVSSLLGLLIFPNMSVARLSCDCGTPQTMEQMRERAFAVFIGKAVETERRLNKDYHRTKFEVFHSWKGARHEHISIYSDATDDLALIRKGKLCGYKFTEGEYYLVFSYRNKNQQGPSWTSHCWPTKPFAQAMDNGDVVNLGRPAYNFTKYTVQKTYADAQNEKSQPSQDERDESTPLYKTEPFPKATKLPSVTSQPYALPTGKSDKIKRIMMPPEAQ